jgi:hypothetical protein
MLGIDRRRAAAALALALAALLPAGQAQAQRRDAGQGAGTQFRIGYVANVPNMFLGGSISIFPGALPGWGLYADVKLDVESPADDEGFIDSLTVEDVENDLGDAVFGQDGSWNSVNVAVVRAISPELAVYVGGGAGMRKEYRQYFDNETELGISGLYWVEDAEVSGTYLNGMAGVMLRLTSVVTAQFGAETSPPGFTVGLQLTLPR